LGHKKALFINMKLYYTALRRDVFDYLPVTFHLQAGQKDDQYPRFLEYYSRCAEESKEDPSFKNRWIVKPGENTNRGNGVVVCDTLEQINEEIKNEVMQNDGKARTYIIQKYIEKPLLYHKRKFDIRCYMMITSNFGRYKAYWYNEGYVRTSSFEYSLKSTQRMLHLTNDAVQK
jgi:Tubulin-tyrosine ligase family